MTAEWQEQWDHNVWNDDLSLDVWTASFFEALDLLGQAGGPTVAYLTRYPVRADGTTDTSGGGERWTYFGWVEDTP